MFSVQTTTEIDSLGDPEVPPWWALSLFAQVSVKPQAELADASELFRSGRQNVRRRRKCAHW